MGLREKLQKIARRVVRITMSTTSDETTYYSKGVVEQYPGNSTGAQVISGYTAYTGIPMSLGQVSEQVKVSGPTHSTIRERNCLIAALDMPVDPKRGDQVLIGSNRWWVEKVSSDESRATWLLDLRLT